MSDKSFNASIPEPDAHGQAALLLSESMLHALVEAKVLSSAEALAVVTTAQDVKIEVAELTGESRGRMQASLELLGKISETFAIDIARG